MGPSLVCPVVPAPSSPPSPVWATPRTRDPLACAGRGRERDESVRDMIDLRAETSSLSDKTESTETQGQSAPHHGSMLGTDPAGRAAQREWLKSGVRRHGCTRRSKEASGKPGRGVARRDPSAWGRTFRTAIDDITRQCLSRRPGSPPSGRPQTRDPLACAGESVTRA